MPASLVSSTSDDLDLLIALNASDCITRPALCRLSSDLDAWRRVDPSCRSAVARGAASLGVPTEPMARALARIPEASRLAAVERRRAADAGVRIITRSCAGYPPALLDHPLPPPVLYVRGELPEAPQVAIVGSRRMDRYGREATELFASGLARAGVVVVSGFALGVDQTAHRACLATEGKTVAVLGCGVDVAYPRDSRKLADDIAARGAVVSEFPMGVEPRAWHFPVRNRVIAALSLGTLVVQAKVRSGSLITAHLALDLGREVWAVPGEIFDVLSMGTNDLIYDGAALVVSPDDILDQIGLGGARPTQHRLFEESAHPPDDGTSTSTVRPSPTVPLPQGKGGRIVEILRGHRDGFTAEALAEALESTVDRVLALLLELELGGWVERLPGPVYVA
ncbi:MAG: DNA-processing protein DprA [Thermoanaerobaculia bacterium]|nr:DNA-processing protein DprA [Thermoanaerobaculia bacterium]